jgi:NAD(P)H-hydrate epimerase
MRLVTVAEMQDAERHSGVSIPELMENAGLAVAQEAWLLLGELADRRILVLCGPGNNGGDGLVAARHLKDWGADVAVALLKERPDDPNLTQLTKREVPVTLVDGPEGLARLDEALAGAELVIDALLGTGRARPIEGALADVMTRLADARERRLPPRLLAVDVPTGVNADTGAVDPLAVAADHTATFQWSKIGLHLQPGAQYTGRVEVVDIGIPPPGGQALSLTGGGEGETSLMTDRSARDLLPPRPLDSHKGTFGSAMVVAGSPQYTGAAYLSCMGALRSGAGIVTLACARAVYPILASKLTEATFEPLDDTEGLLTAREAGDVARALENRNYSALLVGPGLAQGGYPQAFVKQLLSLLSNLPSPAHGRGTHAEGGLGEGPGGSGSVRGGSGIHPDTEAGGEGKGGSGIHPDTGGGGTLRALIIDADGLNNLARIDNWTSLLTLPTILTPHPGELARLTGLEAAEIQADRLGAARKYAAEWNVTLVLKGANTIVAAPDGAARPDGRTSVRISPFTNPGLASGGTGDVLAGIITGLVAQGLPPFDAASLGVHLHGLAGEHVRSDLGPAGMLAGDLLPTLPRVIKELSGD